MTLWRPPQIPYLSDFLFGHWPDGDEDAMRRAAGHWSDMAKALEELKQPADLAMVGALDAIDGKAHSAMSSYWQNISGGDGGELQRLIDTCNSFAEQLEHGATDIEHTKLTIYISAMVMVAMTAWSWVPGAGQVGEVAAAAAVKVTIRAAVEKLLTEIATKGAAFVARRLAMRVGTKVATQAVIGAGIGAGTDAAAQGIQLAAGHRQDGFDLAGFFRATGAGAVAGGVTGPMSEGIGGNLAGRLAGGAEPGLVAGLVGKNVAEVPANVVGNAAAQLATNPDHSIDPGTLLEGAGGGLANKPGAHNAPHGDPATSPHTEPTPDKPAAGSSDHPSPADLPPRPSSSEVGTPFAADGTHPSGTHPDPGTVQAEAPPAPPQGNGTDHAATVAAGHETPVAAQPDSNGASQAGDSKPPTEVRSNAGPQPSPEPGSTNQPAPAQAATPSPDRSAPPSQPQAPNAGPLGDRQMPAARPAPDVAARPDAQTPATDRGAPQRVPESSRSLIADAPGHRTTEPPAAGATPRPEATPARPGHTDTPARPDAAVRAVPDSSHRPPVAPERPSGTPVRPESPHTPARPAHQSSPRNPGELQRTADSTQRTDAPAPHDPGREAAARSPEPGGAHPDSRGGDHAPGDVPRQDVSNRQDHQSNGSSDRADSIGTRSDSAQQPVPVGVATPLHTPSAERPVDPRDANSIDHPTRDGIPDVSPDAYSGGVIRPRDDFAAFEWADDAYERFRGDDSDIHHMARVLADHPREDGSHFSAEDIQQIKNHLFREEHPIRDYDGEIVHRRYDADPDIAEAWIRVRSGRPDPADLVLLEHELAESNYYRDHPGALYQDAHAHANIDHNWAEVAAGRSGERYDTFWGPHDGTADLLQPNQGRPGRGGVPVRGDERSPGSHPDDRQGEQHPPHGPTGGRDLPVGRGPDHAPGETREAVAPERSNRVLRDGEDDRDQTGVDGPVRDLPEDSGNRDRGDLPVREQRDGTEPRAGDREERPGRQSGGRNDRPAGDESSRTHSGAEGERPELAGRGRDSSLSDGDDEPRKLDGPADRPPDIAGLRDLFRSNADSGNNRAERPGSTWDLVYEEAFEAQPLPNLTPDGKLPVEGKPFHANPHFRDETAAERHAVANPRVMEDVRAIRGRGIDNPEIHRLTDPELGVIRSYQKMAVCERLNLATREGSARALRDSDTEIRALVSALNKLPDYRGSVRRGISIDDPAKLAMFLEAYGVGKTPTDHGFASSDKNASAGGNIELIIESRHGKDISWASSQQNEVVFPPGHRFSVESRVFDRENNKYIIRLTDLGRSSDGDQPRRNGAHSAGNSRTDLEGRERIPGGSRRDGSRSGLAGGNGRQRGLGSHRGSEEDLAGVGRFGTEADRAGARRAAEVDSYSTAAQENSFGRTGSTRGGGLPRSVSDFGAPHQDHAQGGFRAPESDIPYSEHARADLRAPRSNLPRSDHARAGWPAPDSNTPGRLDAPGGPQRPPTTSEPIQAHSVTPRTPTESHPSAPRPDPAPRPRESDLASPHRPGPTRAVKPSHSDTAPSSRPSESARSDGPGVGRQPPRSESSAPQRDRAVGRTDRQGERPFSVRRSVDDSGRPISSLVVRVHLDQGPGVSNQHMRDVAQAAWAAAAEITGPHQRLPWGDRPRLHVEFVADPALADLHAAVAHSGGTEHGIWPTGASPEALAGRLREHLGLPADHDGQVSLNASDLQRLSDRIADTNTDAPLRGLPETRELGPGKLAPLEDPSYQEYVRNALREGDRFATWFDPRTHEAANYVNDGGPEVPGRRNSCGDNIMAGLSCFYGDPQISHPRHPDLLPDGSVDHCSPEQGVIDRISDWLDADWQTFGHRDTTSGFGELHDLIDSLGPGSSAAVAVGFHARDPRTGLPQYHADGSPVIESGHGVIVVYPRDAEGPVWWDPLMRQASDRPFPNLVADAASLHAIPLTQDARPYVPQSDSHSRGSGTVPGRRAGHEPEVPDVPVRTGLGDLPDPVRTGDRSGPAYRPVEDGARRPDRSDHRTPEPAGRNGGPDVHGSDPRRYPDARRADLPPANSPAPQPHSGQPGHSRVPDPTRIDNRAAADRGLPAGDRQGHPDAPAARNHEHDGGGVDRPSPTHGRDLAQPGDHSVLGGDRDVAPFGGDRDVAPPARDRDFAPLGGDRESAPGNRHGVDGREERPGPDNHHESQRPDSESAKPADDQGDPPDRSTEPKPSLRDLFPPDGLPVDRERVLQLLRQAVDGEYGGLRFRVESVSPEATPMVVETGIYDTHGNRVGHANRTYSIQDGHITAMHSSFNIQPGLRGRGCATEFNKAMFDWYAQSGGAEVRLTASSSVGCYAWASAGFDFASQPGAVQHIRPNLHREIRRMREDLAQLEQEQMQRPDTERERKIAELADLIKEANGIAKRFYEGSPDFPKPEEIARLGKPANLLPGESRNLTWPGKRVFTEPKGAVSWQGVKIIEEEQR